MKHLLIVLAILVAASGVHAQGADDPRWHDDDPGNDPNLCHDSPGMCTTEEHWVYNWHKARCLAFGGENCPDDSRSDEPAYRCDDPSDLECFLDCVDARMDQHIAYADALWNCNHFDCVPTD